MALFFSEKVLFAGKNGRAEGVDELQLGGVVLMGGEEGFT
jgi:hypothetical protein